MDKPKRYIKTTIKKLRDRNKTFQTLVELFGEIGVNETMLGDIIDGKDEIIYRGNIYSIGEQPLRFSIYGQTRDSLLGNLLGKIETKRPSCAIVKGEYHQEVDGYWDDYSGIIKKDFFILHSLQLKGGN